MKAAREEKYFVYGIDSAFQFQAGAALFNAFSVYKLKSIASQICLDGRALRS